MPYYGEDGKIYSSEQDAQKWGSSSPSSSSGGSEWKPTDLNAGITAADRAFDDQRDREWAEREAERRVKPVLELFDKHKSAYKFYGENKHKEAANDFAIVVNTLRDSGFQKYINDLIRECDLDPEKINRLNEELPKLCVLAGACYGSCVTTDMLVQGNFEEAIKYSHTALTYYSYSGIQKYVNMGISSLPNFYKEHADVCKKNGKTDEANDYYQRAVNIANAEQLAKFGENGIILNVTAATLNNDAEARYKAKNYALAEYLWKKAANEFGDSSAKQKIAKMQKEMEAEASAPQRQTSSAPSTAPQQQASSSAYTPSTPQRQTSSTPSSSEQRNGFLSFIFGLVCGGGGVLTLTWILVLFFGEEWASLLTILGVLIVGIIFAVIAGSAWRNKKNIRFILMLLIGIIGWSSLFGLVPKSLKSIYTNAQEAKTTTEQTATVTADTANFRSAPSTSGDIIKTLKKGDTLTVTGKVENGWVPVKHGDNTGYVSADLLVISE